MNQNVVRVVEHNCGVPTVAEVKPAQFYRVTESQRDPKTDQRSERIERVRERERESK